MSTIKPEKKQVVLNSRLPAAGFLQKLNDLIEPEKFNPFFTRNYRSKKLLRGNTRGNSFTLMLQKRYRNSFRPIFEGEVKDTKTGSEITGNFGIHSFVFVFLIVWLVVASGFVVVLFAASFFNASNTGEKPADLIYYLPLILIAFVSLFGYIAKRLYHREKVELLKRIKEIAESSDDA